MAARARIIFPGAISAFSTKQVVTKLATRIQPASIGSANDWARSTWPSSATSCAGSCTSLLFWLAEQHPQSLDGAIPLSLPAFVAGQLTGQIPTESTTIAIGAINVSTGQWHHEAFGSLGIDHLAWPNLDRAHAPLGETRVGTQHVAVYPAIGDHQCALLGVGLAEDELSVNVSTGSQVSRLTKSAAPGPFQLRALFRRLASANDHAPACRPLA